MFERYTEKARRTIFFARYIASQFGSPAIESEHLLLGLLRENSNLGRWLPNATPETIRQWVEAEGEHRTPIAASVDLPLSNESKRILKQAADEADRLSHYYIGTDHLFLALFAVEDCLAAKLVARAAADAAKIRVEVSQQSQEPRYESRPHPPVRRAPPEQTLEIHGCMRNADHIHDVVRTIRSYNWHWHKTAFRPRDIVVHRKTGRLSFDLGLAKDSKNFELVNGGWKKDYCLICRWELRSSDDEHGTGYTNGCNWLCTECCERFVQRPDFFASSQSEMT